MSLLLLFYEFFKTGLFAIGGGLATLPFLYDMSVRYPDFISLDDITNMIAVSESTPGALGANMATYAGFTAHGVLGGIVATTGLVIPSIIIIIIIAHYLNKFEESKLVKYTFYGLRPATAGLIAAAAFQVLKTTIFTFDKYNLTKNFLDIFDWRALTICVITFILMNIKKLKKIHPIVYIACGAIIGIFIF